MKKSTKRFAVGSALAIAAGYMAGILTAPKSGRETREDIRDAAIKGKGEAERQLKRLHTEMNDMIEQGKAKAADAKGRARTELDDAIDRAKEAKEKVRDMLSAVHEGDAEDKDLSKAVKDAQKAVDHLKSYVKNRLND